VEEIHSPQQVSAIPIEATVLSEEGETYIARVRGEPLLHLPEDLYIPPDALEVFLEAFEGPLDLLLYLIRRQNLDILEIPIADITRQYIAYVELMKAFRLELAAEYLVMAATLAEIKSRLLLPRSAEAMEEEGNDPRAELIRKLQEYEQFKEAALQLDELPRLERDIHLIHAELPNMKQVKPLPEVDLKELLLALKDVMQRVELTTKHQVVLEPLSIRQRMTEVLDKIRQVEFAEFSTLFSAKEGKLGIVVTFIAILELLKQTLIDIVQTEAYGTLHVKALSALPEE
jgi:segregation and condensation protein A